ncbi:ATP-grasp domain-containing protein [Streptosporangium sp. NPDC051022]|uniref:ATP-grasp domain-containing protein n=1 Tax=Streptosporangium sp. NPDC051022 TaxID=3155752 RepID=UPI0034493327
MYKVLLLNSDKGEVVDRLSAREDVNLRIIAAGAYAEVYSRFGGIAHVPAIDDITAVRDAALELARDAPIDHVLAATEKSVIPAALVRAYLGVPGLTVDQAFAFTHKHAMKKRIRAAGLPVAESRLVTDVGGLEATAEAIGRPVVVKPVMGSGGAATFRITSPAELAGLVARKALGSGPYQIERFLPMAAEYHCDGVVRDGNTVFTSVSRYFAPLLSVGTTVIGGSYVLDQESSIARRTVGLHGAVVSALGCRDVVTHLECFETAEGIVVGEITCRPGGGAVTDVVSDAFGVDLWDELIRAEFGEAPRIAPRAPGEVYGWTYLRAGSAAATRIAGLEGVLALKEPSSEGGSFVVRLRAADEDGMRRLHGLISQEVGR